MALLSRDFQILFVIIYLISSQLMMIIRPWTRKHLRTNKSVLCEDLYLYPLPLLYLQSLNVTPGITIIKMLSLYPVDKRLKRDNMSGDTYQPGCGSWEGSKATGQGFISVYVGQAPTSNFMEQVIDFRVGPVLLQKPQDFFCFDRLVKRKLLKVGTNYSNFHRF